MNKMLKSLRRAKITNLLTFALLFLFFYSPCLAKDNNSSDPHLQEGINFLKRSNYPSALDALEKAAQFYRENGDKRSQAKAFLYIARYYKEVGKFDQSIASADSSLKISESIGDIPGSFRALVVLARAYYSRNKKREARIAIEKAEKLLSADISGKDRIDFYLARGMMLRKIEKFDLAKKNFLEALNVSQDLKDSYAETLSFRQLSLLYAQKEEFDDAKRTLANGTESAMNLDRPFISGLLQETDGDIKYKQSLFEEAKVSYLGALTIYRGIGNQGKEGEVLLKLAGLYLDLNDLEKSWEYASEALSVYKSSGNSFGQIQACEHHFAILYLTRDKDKLLKVQKKVIESAESSQDPGDLPRAYFKIGQATAHLTRNRDKALKLYRQAEEKFLNIDDKKGLVEVLMARAIVLRNMHKYSRAIDELEKALVVRKKLGEVLRQDDQKFYHFNSVGAIYRSMGTIYYVQSQFPEAIFEYKKALKHSTGTDRIIDRSFIYSGLLSAELALHEIDPAWRTISQAFEDIRNLEKPEQRAAFYNLVLINLIMSSKKRGFGHDPESYSVVTYTPEKLLLEKVYNDPDLYKRISEAYDDWLKLSIKRKDLRSEIMARLFLGYFYVSGKKYGEAQNQYQKALQLAEETQTTDLKILGYYFLSDLALTRENEEKAMGIMEKMLGLFREIDDLPGQLHTLRFIGRLKQMTKNYPDSLKRYDRAVLLAEKMSDNKELIESLVGRGKTLYLARNYKRSLRDYREALQIAREINNKNLTAVCLAGIARNQAEMGNLDKAIENYTKAFGLYKELNYTYKIRDLALELGKTLKEKNLDDKALEVYTEALNRFITMWEKVPEELGRMKVRKEKSTRILFEQTISLLIKTGRFEEALKYLETSRSVELLNDIDLEKLKVGDEKTQSLIEKVKKLQRKMYLIRDDIKKAKNEKKRANLSRVLASTRGEFFATINEIKSKNPDFDRLLSVRGTELAAIQKMIPPDALMIEYYPSPEALYLFLVTTDTFNIRKVEVKRDELYQLVKKLRDQLSNPANTKVTADFQKNRTLLYSLMIKPVEDELDYKEKILVIPGGLLWYLPVEVLGDEGGPFLIQEKQVSYISSANILKMVQGRKDPDDEAMHLAAFSAPPQLDVPFTSREVEKIGSIIPDSRVFIGDESTRERFFREAPRSSLLHIASHSKLNREDVNKSFITFAGKNGKLYLGEIYGIPLKDTSLVTLSSCESALGKDNPGGEFASLASAFTTAGASSVIASLWKVDDKATAELFVEFYKNLIEGKSRTESLRLAKIKLIENPETSHPYFWGSFILMGDWR